MISKSKRKRKHSVAKKVKAYMKEYIPLILIVLLCLILLTVTAATSNWYGVWVGTSRNMTHYDVGLWDYTSEETERKDIRVEMLFNDFRTMGPVIIIVLFLHLATIICSSLYIRNIIKPYSIYLATLSVIVSIVLLLAVVIIYIKSYEEHGNRIQVKIGWSFVLMIILFILQFFVLFSFSYMIYKERQIQKRFQRKLKHTESVFRNRKSIFINGELSDVPGQGKENASFQREEDNNANNI